MLEKLWRLVAVFGVLALVAAGCGDDDGDAASDSTDDPADESTTTAPEVDLPEGEPIKFAVATAVSGVVAQPEIFAAADAAVAAINADGGIPDPAGGPNRPLEVVRCEAGAGGNVDPDAALKCAQDTIDEGEIAVVGRYLFGEDGTQAWADAGIPMIGSAPVEIADFVTELVYPISGGAITGGPGVGIMLQEAGAETVALITGDVEAGRQLPGLMKPGLAEEDDLVQEVYVPLDPSADYTPQLTQLVSANPDAVAVFGSTDINVRAIAGLRSAGYTGLIGVPGTGLSPEGIDTLGDAGEGLLVLGAFEAARGEGEAIQQFNEEMDATAPDAARTDLAVNAWASVHLFADALRDADAIDAPSLIAALDGREVDLGVAPPFTMGVPDNAGLNLPRIFRNTFQIQEVRDGEIVPAGDGEFLDVNDYVSG